MVDDLTPGDAMDNLGLTREALKEAVTCWLEDTTGQNRQFFTGRLREIDGLVTRIRNIPRRRRA